MLISTDWEAVLKQDANDKLAKAALTTLPQKQARYEEEQKAEAMGMTRSLCAISHLRPAAKLKEIGNSFLGLFGMSTDNFKVVQDPKSGGYSVSIQK